MSDSPHTSYFQALEQPSLGYTPTALVQEALQALYELYEKGYLDDAQGGHPGGDAVMACALSLKIQLKPYE